MPSGRWPPVAMIFLSDPSGLTENTRPSARSRMNKRLDMCFPFRICFDGAQLRHPTDAAAFAIVVDDQPAVFGGDEAHGERELRGAIAAQRPEHLAGHALRLQAQQGCVARERASDEHERRFDAAQAVPLEAERLERAPPGRQLGRRNLPYGHSAGAFFAAGIAPLALSPAISAAPNPSCCSTCSLCSPSPGARFAGTLATPCTWIGLLIVEVSLPPTPSSGTTMSFARSCGSLITSSGPRTAPNVTWTPLKTSYQCAIGCAPKTSSRIAESCGILAISFAGSENRGSVRRSVRPMAFATAASLSDVTSRTNHVPSAA